MLATGAELSFPCDLLFSATNIRLQPKPATTAYGDAIVESMLVDADGSDIAPLWINNVSSLFVYINKHGRPSVITQRMTIVYCYICHAGTQQNCAI